jgi:hypothetical protein
MNFLMDMLILQVNCIQHDRISGKINGEEITNMMNKTKTINTNEKPLMQATLTGVLCYNIVNTLVLRTSCVCALFIKLCQRHWSSLVAGEGSTSSLGEQ